MFPLTALVRSHDPEDVCNETDSPAGTQTHISGGMGAGVQGALEQLASAPVDEVAITELDIANSPVDDYTAVVQACLNVEKCVGITVWGVSDKASLRRDLSSAFMLLTLT